MKKFLKVLFSLIMLFALVACAPKEDPNKKEEPDDPNSATDLDKDIDEKFRGLCEGTNVYLTTIGQADLASLENVISYAEITEDKYTMDNDLVVDDVEKTGDKTPVVLLVVGTSGKGLGAAGTNIGAEQKRAEEFSTKAKAGEIIIVLFHVGGVDRRGDTTDPILNIVCPAAKVMLVVESGNTDKYFTNSAKTNKNELYLFSKYSKMPNSIKILFNPVVAE